MSIDRKKRDLLHRAGFKRVLDEMTGDQNRTSDEMVSCNTGEEIVFIYDEGAPGTQCHAVIKNLNGPWSENRTGLCGITPCIGPVPWCKNPDGGLCHLCEKEIVKIKGKWYLR